MLTIFTTPKSFIGHNKTIQDNAIKSWKKLVPECEVILLGKDFGTAEAARQFGCKYIPDVKCSEYGTPLISSLFYEAEKAASNTILCYVNSDIILTNGLMEAIKLLQERRNFLLIGQRYDVDITEPLNFDGIHWSEDLVAFASSRGKLHATLGIDYFIFPKSQCKKMPPLTVGRAGWDNWMIQHARRRFISILDGTKMIVALHQNHDYSHCKGGKLEAYRDGPEVKKNLKIVGEKYGLLGIHDALLVLKNGKIVVDFQRIDGYLCSFHKAFPCLIIPIYLLRKVIKFSGLGFLLSHLHS